MKRELELQVLIATVNNKDINNTLSQMNISSECIVTNQTNKFSYEEFVFKKQNIKVYNFDEKGVGLNRNNALMRANKDIAIFADEDIKYIDGYEGKIINEFKKHPKADMIVFNVESNDKNRPRYIIKKFKKVCKYNCLRYGAVRIAIRVEKLKEKNIYFSLLFGGGAKYSSGEDSLFILECIRKGMKVYASPEYIATIPKSDSTWFKGYNEKFFFDKAKFFKISYGRLAYFMCLQLLIRHRYMWKKFGFKKAHNCMIKGIKYNK